MLYLVGLSLGDAKDITVKGLEIVKKADFLGSVYISPLCRPTIIGEKMEEFSSVPSCGIAEDFCISFASYFKITRDCAVNYAWFFEKEFLIFRNPAPHSK